MLGLAPASAYPALEPLPFDGPAIHGVGDMHFGLDQAAADHASYVQKDLRRLENPALLVQVGDMTDASLAAQDALAKAAVAAFPCPNKRTLVGNHDINYNGYRTGAAAQAAWGFNALQWTYDLGPVLVIGLSPSQHADGADVVLVQADLDWLDAQLAAATKPCWVFHHATLDDPAHSYAAGFFAQPDAQIKAILNARPQVKAWVAGHNHFDIADPKFARLQDVGTRQVANINVGATAYINQPAGVAAVANADDPVRTIFLVPDIDGNADLWIRDHRAGAWMAWPDTGQLVRRLVAT